MKQIYINKNFASATLELIDHANSIIDEYVAQGYRLTVRQLYYQLVARDIVPNTVRSYDRVATTLSEGRMAGMVDWDAIEDRTREFIRRARWESAKDILGSCARQFHKDMWVGQERRVFVIVEKEALAGVLEPVCKRWDIPLLAARGYPSVSVLREFAMEDLIPTMRGELGGEGQGCLILHLGDHDPSGIDMTRDLEDRLTLFCGDEQEIHGRHGTEIGLELRRIALNMDQIKKYNPPPNPAKQTDSRFQGYNALHGDESWELDALEPKTLTALIDHHVAAEVDDEAWQEREAEINTAKIYITKVSEEAP